MDRPPVLALYFEYSRKDVHDIFSTDTRFTPSSGTWGLHGIVEIPNSPGDFVFFVTFGQHQAGHTFDEWITEEGVMAWQSQPRQSLQDRKIQQLIHHDENRNTIYLFLRTQRISGYTYLGRLKYLTHDPAQEKPVFMYWQLLDWPIPDEVLSRMHLTLQPAGLFYQVMRSKSKNRSADFQKTDEKFIWRGKTWMVDRNDLIAQIREWTTRGLPEEAVRFRDWYIEVDEIRISPKWVFHLITEAGYNEFDAPTARRCLAEIGIMAMRMNADHLIAGEKMNDKNKAGAIQDNIDEEDYGNGTNQSFVEMRDQIFSNISQRLPGQLPARLQHGEIRYRPMVNYIQVVYPEFPNSIYELRFSRQTGIVAFYFGGPLRYQRVEEARPLIGEISQSLGYPIKIDTHMKTWTSLAVYLSHSMPLKLEISSLKLPFRLGLKRTPPYIDIKETDSDVRKGIAKVFNQNPEITLREAIIVFFTGLLAKFIQVTYDPLVDIMGQQLARPSYGKYNALENKQPQIQVLEGKINHIQRVLAGSDAIPSNEILCDWIHFCYDFGLYREGQMLFTFVTSEQVNPWYYERTKKFARLCSMKTDVKGQYGSNQSL